MTSRSSANSQLTGWVAYLDAYGFASAQSGPDGHRIEAFLTDISDCLDTIGDTVSATYQFSDSVFLIQDSSSFHREQFVAMVDAIKDLQETALNHGTVFRGALAFGEILHGPNRCFGKPVTRAARMEQRLSVPIVAIPERELLDSKLAMVLGFVEVPTKTGIISAHLVRPKVSLYRQVADLSIQHTLVHGPDHVPMAWRAALAVLNTSEEGDANE